MQHRQHIGGPLVQFGLVATPLQNAGEGVVPQVFQQEEPAFRILRQDLGRAQAKGKKVPRDAHEGPYVFLWRRRVHHDCGAL
jgi:hypothetical protein